MIKGDMHIRKVGSSFPPRKLTRKQKKSMYGSDEEWGINYMLSIETFSGLAGMPTSWVDRYSNITQNLDLIEKGRYNSEEFESWVNPHKLKNGKTIEFPIKLKHYDILSSKLQVLIGEEITRPFNYQVVNKSADSINKFQEEQSKMIYEFIKQDFLINVQKEFQRQQIEQEVSGITNPEKPEVKTPEGRKLDSIEQIKQYFQSHYSDELEEVANDFLVYLEHYLNLQLTFNRNFIRFLASGREIYYTGLRGSDLITRIVDPRFFTCNISHDEILVEKCDWAREERFMTLGDIVDEFYDDLTEEEIEYLDYIVRGDYTPDQPVSVDGYIFNDNNITGIRVARFEWKALRKIGIVTTTGEDGEITKMLVDEEYKLDKDKDNQQVEWKWVNETWEGYRIAGNIFTRVQPLPYQFRNLDNISETRSSYTGIITEYSLVDKIKPHQFFYNVVMHQLAMAFARAKGKAMLLDVNQIPQSQGWDIERWMYYIDVFGIAPINPMEKNQQTNESSKFNQWQVFDLSLGNTINSYIAQLEFLKNEISDITGITPQREGQIRSSETVGGIERSVGQSSAITESYFYLHNEAKKSTLQNLLDAARMAYKSSEKIQYILGDKGRKILELSDDFRYGDFGVFVSDTTKELKALKMIQDYAIQGLANKQLEFSTFIPIMRSNSVNEAKMLVLEQEFNTKKSMEEQQKIQQQMLQQQQEMEKAAKEMEMQLKQKELEMDKYKVDQDNAVRLEVAKLQAGAQVTSFRTEINPDKDSNGIPDIADLQNAQTKEDELDFKKEQHKDQMKLEKEKLKVQRSNKSQ